MFGAVLVTYKLPHTSQTPSYCWIKVVFYRIISSKLIMKYLPGRAFAMIVHLFPWILWSLNIFSSSSLLHSFFSIPGLRWLCHLKSMGIYLYRHCFPERGGVPNWELNYSAMLAQFLFPNFLTSSLIAWSSSSVHTLLELILSYFPVQQIWNAKNEDSFHKKYFGHLFHFFKR